MIKQKKLLIIGGTRMVGRDFVEFLLEKEHNYDLYIANRGTNKNLFKDIKHINIDRNEENKCYNLKDMYFDLVIDFSCYNSTQLKNILRYIEYEQYIILSTLCVFSDEVINNPNHWMHDYCKSKKELESYIFTNKLQNFTIIRPCVLYGKNDYTNRFYEKNNIIYWKHNNLEVIPDKYHINVRAFSVHLYGYISKNLVASNIIHINGEGITITENKIEYKIHRYESKYLSIQKFNNPFNYIIIDNLFNKEMYSQICKKFPEFIARTTPYKDQPGATSDYEGYISGLGLGDLKNGYDFFASKDLQNFVEKSFNIKTSKYISPSAHFHRAPSKNGFIHRDMNICSFSTKFDHNEFVTAGGVVYTDDTKKNLNSIKMIRSIAVLYYINNDDSLDAVGGGTGIYDNTGNLLLTIEPKNNRLFIFEISHNSYHAFIGANFDRSAIVSWFHSSPAYIINRNWKYFKENKNYIERWTKIPETEYWSIENDQEYNIYFNKPLKELLDE